MEGQEEKIIKTGGLGYSGMVRIKLYSGNSKQPYKVIEKHNTGTAEFFKFILNCIRGINVPRERPWYMELWDKEFTTQKVGVGFQLIGDSAPVILAETDNHLEDRVQMSFNAFIADNYISGRSFQGIRITNLDGVEYSLIKLDDIVEITGQNTNVSIDWVITLGNVQPEV